jgi:hypothetical protein
MLSAPPPLLTHHRRTATLVTAVWLVLVNMLTIQLNSHESGASTFLRAHQKSPARLAQTYTSIIDPTTFPLYPLLPANNSQILPPSSCLDLDPHNIKPAQSRRRRRRHHIRKTVKNLMQLNAT